MTESLAEKKDYTSLFGVVAGISAYLIWGLSPVYWKELQAVAAFEIIVHRIVWSFLFLLALVILRKQLGLFMAILKSPRTLLLLCVTSLFVSVNWLVYIWSVNHGFIVQASLGYYINPLVNILLGMIFLKERLRRVQIVAVVLAFCGVLFLTVFYRTFPWVALTLAFTFGLYALIRKTAAVGALIGLTMETLLLSIPATIYLVYLKQAGEGAFGHIDHKVDLMLAGTALVTAVPLLLFNLAGKRLMLATLGFLQYLAPTCMLAIGVVVWGNVLVPAQWISFLFIWVALALYSADSVYTYRINHFHIK